jgi:hypothetical protein
MAGVLLGRCFGLCIICKQDAALDALRERAEAELMGTDPGGYGNGSGGGGGAGAGGGAGLLPLLAHHVVAVLASPAAGQVLLQRQVG